MSNLALTVPILILLGLALWGAHFWTTAWFSAAAPKHEPQQRHLRLVPPPAEECLDCHGDIEPARVRLGATSCAWCAKTYA